MFLSGLTDNQKVSFLFLLHDFVRADNKLTKQEKQIVAVLETELGCDLTSIPKDMDFAKASNSFRSFRTRRVVLFELIGVGYVDTEFSIEESEYVLRLADRFGVSEVEVQEMQSIVLSIISAVQDAETYITGD